MAAFLDLQGTLGGDGFGDVRDFSFFPWSIPAVKLLNEAGLPVIIVTNQSRIAPGLITWQQFEARVDELRAQLAGHGARLDAVYCCPHTDLDGCACRKPLPGLVMQAQRDLGLDLASCYVVGDIGVTDMTMARAAGCHAVLVRTGLGEGSLGAYRHLWAGIEPDFVATDVLEAARWIVGRRRPDG